MPACTIISSHLHTLYKLSYSCTLDNCLWRTDAVINGANDALAALLQAHGVTQRTEHVMKQLFAANQTKYAPACTNHAKAPVYLTQLRKDALAQLLLPHHDTEAAVATDYLFDAWAQARHDAIPDALADNVVSTLQRLRQHLHPPRVLMGAVTDGNADPRRLAILEPYFDFVVHAEAVGVAKPDPQIYLTAMQQVVSRLENEDDENENAPRYTITDDQVGAWWVHVGDDFVKDIVAAKAMGMRTVWTREFLPKNDQQSPPNQLDKKQGSVEELVKRVSSQKVVKMSVGAEDYLANSLQLDFADAVVDKFADLADILIAWHKEGQAAAQAPSDNNMNSPLEVVYPTKPSASPATDTPSPTTKFCVHCGTCLPAVAKFCSSCGENQPPLP